jgi:hypothetical protein
VLVIGCGALDFADYLDRRFAAVYFVFENKNHNEFLQCNRLNPHALRRISVITYIFSAFLPTNCSPDFVRLTLRVKTAGVLFPTDEA